MKSELKALGRKITDCREREWDTGGLQAPAVPISVHPDVFPVLGLNPGPTH